MWKVLCESVEGTSHRKGGTPCQDAAFSTPFRSESDEGVILVCADGAGSAKESQTGARVACQTAANRAMRFLEARCGAGDIDADTLRDWFAGAHAALNEEAARLAVEPRELACTLLLAVVGRSAAAFAQVGDGVIVVADGDAYRHVFWPQAGEYHNTTFFLTDRGFNGNVQSELMPRAVTELSLMSDGLQMLALDYARRAVHQGFFADLFRSLRAAESHHDLIVPMRQWLDSDAVNGRTDDDKTLILATRVATGGDTAV